VLAREAAFRPLRSEFLRTELIFSGLRQDLGVEVGCCEGVVGTSSRGFIALVPIPKREGKDAPARFGRCALRSWPLRRSGRIPALPYPQSRRAAQVVRLPRTTMGRSGEQDRDSNSDPAPGQRSAAPFGLRQASRGQRSPGRAALRVEQVPWCDGKNQLTTTYRWFLAGWAKRLSWKPPYQNLWVELFSAECCEAGAARLEFPLFSTF